jgi:hypothetical protein
VELGRDSYLGKGGRAAVVVDGVGDVEVQSGLERHGLERHGLDVTDGATTSATQEPEAGTGDIEPPQRRSLRERRPNP